MIQDQRSLEAMGSHVHRWTIVAGNIFKFSGPWIPGGLALAAGAIVLCVKDRLKAAMLLVPVAVYFTCLSLQSEGAWARYLFAVYPGLALVAGAGIEYLCSGQCLSGVAARWPRAFLVAVLAALMLPGGMAALAFDLNIALPDTRTLAARWIEGNLPPGTKLLLDQEHATPRVRMSREAAERMLVQTRASGHPRQRYYELMLSGHPGGGYGIYRLLRDPKDLHTGPRLAAMSAQGQPIFNARAGLAAVRAAGIEVVVFSSIGANPGHSPDLAPFFSGVEREGRLLVEFTPEPGRSTGPRLRLYRILTGPVR